MIFYFTATGNSKYIAEKIAAGTGDRVTDIAGHVQNGRFSFELQDGEALGFVVPVYFLGVPVIVDEFLRNLRVAAKHSYYAYAVLNSGGMTGGAEALFRRAFPVGAVYGIAMVDNYVPMYKTPGETEIAERLDKAERDTAIIIERVVNRDTGTFDALKGRFPRLFTFAAYPLYKYGRKTRKFSVSERCSGCGLCEKICPREAIQLRDGKPAWTMPQCEICLACLHRCPDAAINYGKKTAGNGRYVNPRVDL